ncbi:MAG: MBL fold metallo-hydrolase [Thermoprotei archaeon]|nr:MAG: MBL fold metallo-hydrolase [Thermoprotei archaeon]
MKGKKILFDYGAMITEREPKFPLHVRPKELDAIFLTHAHLDHSGTLPLLYISEKIPLYTTKLTAELASVLLRDFIKISKYHLPFEAREIQRMLNSVKYIEYGDSIELDSITITPVDAGHIPGSTSFIVDTGDMKMLITGDINTNDTCLLSASKIPKLKFDVVITEATYALYDHPPREKVERILVQAIEEVLSSNGSVLIPSFSVGRSQEVLCILCKYGLDSYPIFIDGMARKVSSILLKYKSMLKDPKLYERSLEAVVKVDGRRMRKDLLKTRQNIIVTPAGMLKGGPARFYLRRMCREARNGIFLVSYQAPGSTGRVVLSKGTAPVDGKGKARIKARVEWFDLSSHTSRSGILSLIEELKAYEVIIVHTTLNGGLSLANILRNRGLKAEVPTTGDIIEITS